MNFIMLATSTAGDPAAAGGGFANYTFIIMIVVMLAALYFLMLRPQKKKEKKANEMRNSIEIGDEVTTIGGIVGRVVNLKEDTFIIETAGDRSRMRFKRWAIQEVSKLSLDTGAEPEAATPAAPKKERRRPKKETKEADK